MDKSKYKPDSYLLSLFRLYLTIFILGRNKMEDRLGRVPTPIGLIQEIYSLLAPYLRKDMHVYEPGVGDHRFYKHFPMPCTYEGCEIEPGDLPPNIYRGDFFTQPLVAYDLILGNPPFRVETTGPSTSPIPKKPKQKTIWASMVMRCFKHLKPDGILAMVLPCIWMKPDRAGIYELFTQHRLLYLTCYSCVESNKLFGYKGQTPVCVVLVQKSPPQPSFHIYDRTFVSFTLLPNHCIPTRNARLLQYSRSLFHESLRPIKIATETRTDLMPSPVRSPVLYTYKQNEVYGIEDASGLYQGTPKVMMLHKSKPIPILDQEGIYGVGGRDKYVFLEDPPRMFTFLSQPIVQEIILSFTVRMNFYEKYAFDYLPCLKESENWLNKITEYVNGHPQEKYDKESF